MRPIAVCAFVILALAPVPVSAASVMISMHVPVRCDLSLAAGSDAALVSSGELGTIEGSCNVPHSISLTTPEINLSGAVFAYDDATEPFRSGMTTFRRREGARGYQTPLFLHADSLDHSERSALRSTVKVVPAI